jgi:parallel beta-helix repeat protein
MRGIDVAHKALLVLVYLFVTFPFASELPLATDEYGTTGMSLIADYTTHDPIVITSNDDFETQGWPGSGTPEEPYVIEGLSISGASDAGIDISFVSVYFIIRDCLITSCHAGISTVYTSNGLLVNNTCNSNDGGGIYLREQSNNITIINNTLSCNQMGVYFWGWYDSSTNVTVIGNTCNDNSDTGIFIDRAVSVIVANNTCYYNCNGIQPHYATSVVLENNTIYGGQYGIKVDGGNNISITWNVMRGNHYPAKDTGGHSFDHNYYHDYDGMDENDDRIGDTPYDRNGVFDIHPMMYPPGYGPPTVNHPNDMEIESGSTGYSIVWTYSPLYPYLGLFPYRYEVFMNGTSIGTGSTATVEVYLDGPDIGLYNYTIVITDDDNHSTADTVLVTVVDTIPPYIDSPDDLTYEEFGTGYSITWNPSDPHPSNYKIYLDGEVYKSGLWNSSSETVTVSVDGLSQGTHNFTIVVIDVGLNWVGDTVFVTVAENMAPLLDSPSDIKYDELSTGNMIIWSPSDAYPFQYTVYKNDSVHISNGWDGSQIPVDIDGLGIGVYNFTILVEDAVGNAVIDTVIVTVVDGTTPTLDSPSDVLLVEGGTDYVITWKPYDLHPISYTITCNDIVIASGLWNTSDESISLSLLDFTVGTYNVTLVVTDIGGNEATDMVIVTVLPDSTTTDTTTTSPQADSQFQIMDVLGLGIGFGVLLSVIVFAVLRKRE